MSDREYEDILRERDAEEQSQFFERNILGRPFTLEERASFKQNYQPLSQMRLGPDSESWQWRLVWRDLAKQLKAKQGSVLPDFNDLFRRKSELDGEL